MIQVNDKVRITKFDEKNLQLEELCDVTNPKTKETRKEWKWKGYYGDLRSAIGGVLKHCSTKLIEEDLNGWKSVLERLDKIDKELKGAIKNDEH